MFVRGTYESPSAVSSLEPISALEDFSGGAAAPPRRLGLLFAGPVECGGTASASFEVGLAVCDGSKDAGEFTVGPLSEFDSKCGWAVDAMQGSVDAGALRRVTVSFSPPDPEPDQLCFFGVDEWRTLSLSLTLKCGDQPPAEYLVSARCELLAGKRGAAE